MTMREKMAREMHRRSDQGYREWDDEHPNVRGDFLRHADAALSALEEPTDEMWEAGYATDYFPGSTWDAMIRKAKEG